MPVVELEMPAHNFLLRVDLILNLTQKLDQFSGTGHEANQRLAPMLKNGKSSGFLKNYPELRSLNLKR